MTEPIAPDPGAESATDAHTDLQRRTIERLEARCRELEAARRADRQRLDHYAATTAGWFWETDSDLRFTYMSPSVRRITGVAPEWHYGKTREELGLPALVAPEDWQAHLETLRRREPFNRFTFARKGPDGIKWLQTSGAAFFDADGRFAGYRGTATDITDEIAVQKRSALLAAAIENINDLFVLWDPDDVLVTCNARFREINAPVIETTEPGTLFEDHIRAALAAGLYPDAAGREEAWVAERIARHRDSDGTIEMRRQNDRWILVRDHRLPDGSIATISTDITDRKRAERELEREHGILTTALKTIPDGVQVLDADLRLVAWNDALFDVLDLDGPAILAAQDPGRAFRHALASRGEYGEGDVDTLVASREAIARTPVPVNYERRLVTGKWMECRGTPIDGGGYVAIYRDIDASRRLQRRLERLATYDDLTGALNRRSFLATVSKEFERSLRYGRPLSVLVLDADHFKRVNDTYGHAAGDDTLVRIVAACRDALRDTDSLGRIGGEEFAVLLPETALDEACRTAERLRESVAAVRVPVGGESLRITVSIGVATMTDGQRDASALVDRADRALYEAKRGGRNRVVAQTVPAPACVAHTPAARA